MITINIDIKDQEVNKLLSEMVARGKDLSPALNDVGNLVRESIRRNFREGGRPEKWKPSGRATRDAGYGQKHGQTLVDTKRLMNSFTFKAGPHSVRVGTNVEYAGAHHFGFSGTVNVRAHRRRSKGRDVLAGKKKVASGIALVRAHVRKIKIEARPFVMVQDADWPRIELILRDYLLGGRHA